MLREKFPKYSEERSGCELSEIDYQKPAFQHRTAGPPADFIVPISKFRAEEQRVVAFAFMPLFGARIANIKWGDGSTLPPEIPGTLVVSVLTNGTVLITMLSGQYVHCFTPNHTAPVVV